MSVKYTKGNQTWSLSERVDKSPTKIKLRYSDDPNDEPTTENIWCVVDGETVTLVNHSVFFMPYETWGTVHNISKIKNDHIGKIVELIETEELQFELHPDAWWSYLDRGVIDADGNWIPNGDRKK